MASSLTGGRSLFPFCEPVVVPQECRLALLRGELHTNAHRRTCPVEALLQHPLEDHEVDVLHIGRGSLTVQWGNQNQGRIQLLGLLVEDLVEEGLLDSLGKL